MDTDINFFAINDEPSKSHFKTNQVFYYSSPNEAIIFGNFTLEECSRYQEINTTTSTVHSNKHAPLPYPLSPSYFRQLQCIRCGYSSHSIENCVARRNIYGEFIACPSPLRQKIAMFPVSTSTSSISPVHSDVHYYNHHLITHHPGDKTDYSEFVFSEDEVREWIDDQQMLFVPPLPPVEPFHQVVYVPMIVENNSTQSVRTLRVAYYEQEIINYALMCNYAMTNYMFGGNMQIGYP